MGKKKGKPAKEKEEREESGDDDDGEIDISDLAASLAAAKDDDDEPEKKAPPAPTDTDAAADDDDAVGSSKAAVKGGSSTRYIPDVPYCEITGLPFEYCEFHPLIAKARENFEKVYEKHFPGTGEDGLEELMISLGMKGDLDAAAKKAQGGKKPKDPSEGGGGGGGKKKGGGEAQIVIELNNRNKKKHITVVKGLELFGVDTAAAAKLFGKRFACGSALVKGANGQADQIDIQGSCRDKLPAIIVEKLKMDLENIYLLIDGKKIKASDGPSG